MATTQTIVDRVRLELGDLAEPFRTSIQGNGEQDDFELTTRNIIAGSVDVFRVNADATLTSYTPTTDYTLDSVNGTIHFVDPLPRDQTVIVAGRSYGIFSDDELQKFVLDAASQHLNNRTGTTRYRDGHGFIKYDRVAMDLEAMPSEEDLLVSILATVEALWALATDASLDINIQTSEGTTIPRGQRHAQIVQQIQLLTDKYEITSLAMGVGLFAPEVMTARRVSRSTGRLVPVFIEREYDETGPPVRAVPPISQRGADPDGPASPWYPSGYGN